MRGSREHRARLAGIEQFRENIARDSLASGIEQFRVHLCHSIALLHFA